MTGLWEKAKLRRIAGCRARATLGSQWLEKVSRSLAACEGGATAIEFAFITPLASIGLMLLGLSSFQFYHRTQLNQAVRAASEFAWQDPGADALGNRVKDILQQKGYTIATAPVEQFNDTVVVGIGENCWCPETPSTVNACTTICLGGRPGVRRYVISAAYYPTWPQKLLSGLLQLGILPSGFGARILSEMEVDLR